MEVPAPEPEPEVGRRRTATRAAVRGGWRPRGATGSRAARRYGAVGAGDVAGSGETRED